MFKSGILLSGGNILAALLGLVRNIVIARLLSVEDFGIASTFAITMAIIEMTSNVALDRLIVQAKDGEDSKFQATLHTIQVVRGVLGSAILLLIAHPVALLFGIPDIAWAYQVLAIVPLVRGLAHLDMFRMQREMRFLPFVSVELTSQAFATIAAFLLAIKLNDYRAMLFALVIQQLIYLTMSHVVARKRYELGWASDIARRALQYGWPLLLNGLLMFGIFQGDRVIVGSVIGLTELGWFSAAFTLTLVPTLVIGKTLNSYFLPLLSNSQNDTASFQEKGLVTIQAAILLGVGLSMFFFAVGEWFFLSLFGPKYTPALEVLLLLSVMQAIRNYKAGPSIIALSTAHTNIPLIANVLRGLAIPVIWIVASKTGDLVSIVLIAMLAEVLGLVVSFFLLKTKIGFPIGPLVPCVFVSFSLLSLVVLAEWVGLGNTMGCWTKIALSLCALAPLIASMPSLRNWALQINKNS